MHVTFYFTSQQVMFDGLGEIELKICDDQKILHGYIFDRGEVMRLSQGKKNPAGAFLMKTSDDKILKDYFQLIHWIEKNGFIQI